MPPTMAHDIFLMQKFGMSDKETLLRHMPEEDKKWMEVEMAKGRQGRAGGTWYNVPMQIMAQLVFKVIVFLHYFMVFLGQLQ